MKTPLRRKILVYSSSLLIVLIATMLVYVDYQAERFVSDRIDADIQQGRELIKNAEDQRLQNLSLTAGVVASFPALKGLLDTHDPITVRDFLTDYQQRTSTQLFIVLDTERRVVAGTDAADTAAIPANFKAGVLKTVNGVYHAAIAPAEAGGTLFGFVIAGQPIDDNFARSLNETSKDDIAIVGETLLASNLPRSSLPWQKRSEWEAQGSSIMIEGQNYRAASTLFGKEGGIRPLVVVMQSHDRAIAPYRRIQAGLLILGLIAAIVGVAVSAAVARNVTAPVAKLVEGTQQVAAGNFDYRLDVRTGDEIGELATSFNTMIQGLRERADMQKFVSQSTVDMIQSTTHRKVSAGERLRLTIFFSDMRGFTAMTENRPPEETVKLLNSCLSLQADKVKKFHGDVDKFVGDCVVALFDGEDMELHAIRCAVEIHKALEELNTANPAAPPIHVGIGIVTGEVILGSIGSADRRDFTVIGSNVNLCSRLCSRAGPRQTLIAESTYQRVSDLVAAQKIEPLQVKGFTDPVPVYRMR